MSYITESDLENLILEDIDSSYSSFITQVIGYVEAYVDQYCGTNFVLASSGARYFDGSGNDELYVGDFSATTQVEILDINGQTINTLTVNQDYWEKPYNLSTKNTIQLAPAGQIRSFPCRPRAVKVTGTFGYAAVPEPVKLAAVQLAAKVVNLGLRGGQVKSESLGSYSITYKDIDEESDSLGIKEILDQYARVGLE